AEIKATQTQIDSLSEVIRKAKADLASGSVESMRRAIERYRAGLGLMRRLVPEGNDVPTLLDQISNRAKVRGLTVGTFQPLSVEPGPPLALTIREPGDTGKTKKPGQPAFDIYRYHYEIYGHYDDIGEFLSDVASLARIMVPQSVVLKAATAQTQKFVGDTMGALLEADFDLRTYVKRVPVASAGAANARP
ncbi:MAG TPA: type 4a pilus biogenesis protein PilO, partial [Gemmatimonadales bacterium]|nr:type 4a pilus biogenesis protein PilO [Gemmatimonadales bacterium]